MLRISTKFEILVIIMWNLLKPIPKIRFWPNLAKFWPKIEKGHFPPILCQNVAFLKFGTFWPKFGHLAIWPNGQISKFQWSALKCVKFWIYHFLMQNRTNLIFFKIWPKIGQIRPSFWPNLAKIWFLGSVSNDST